MRKHALFLFVFLLLLLTGCAKNEADRYDLPADSKTVGGDRAYTDIAVHGDTMIGIADGKLFRVNLTTGEEDSLDELSEGARHIAMDGQTLWCLDGVGIRSFRVSEDSLAATGEIPLPDLDVFLCLDALDGRLVTTDGRFCAVFDSGRWNISEIPVSGDEHVTEVRWIDSQTVAAVVSSDANGSLLYRFTPTKRKLTPLSERDCAAADANGSHVYMASNTTLYRIGKKSHETVMRLRPPAGATVPVKIFTSANSVLALWDNGTPVLYRRADGGQSLKMLTNDHEYQRALGMTSAVKDIPCTVVQFDTFEFYDKINAKMLAQDDDYDLILLGSQPESVAILLESIIRYGQYVDLYEDAGLRANLDEMLPGAKEILETDGKLAALPVEYTFHVPGMNRDAAEALGIEPSFESETDPFTLDELWQIADDLCGQDTYSLLSSGPGGLKPVSLLSMLQSSLLAKYDFTQAPPEEMKEDIDAFFVRLGKYRDAGILIGDNPLFVSMHTYDVFGMPETLLHSPEILPVAFPSASPDTKSTIRTHAMIVINPNSPRRDLIFQFLTALTSEENRYNTYLFSTPFWPDMMRYYRGKTSDRMISLQAAETAERMEEILGNFYSHGCRNSTGSTLETWNVMNDFCDGNLSAEEAAAEVYRHLRYQYLG
ncbi:MAG: hypothetical protein J6V24_03820 [Clostridia bacterium]|nr:hypothetical protein [Clostridia bacterium]